VAHGRETFNLSSPFTATGRFRLGLESRKWINEHLPELRRKYPNKTVIVCEGRVVRAIDEPVDPLQVNEVARRLCRGRDWSYTYVSEREEEYIL